MSSLSSFLSISTVLEALTFACEIALCGLILKESDDFCEFVSLLLFWYRLDFLPGLPLLPTHDFVSIRSFLTRWTYFFIICEWLSSMLELE